MRDDLWLQQRLEQIWEMIFSDVQRLNTVTIRWKGKWKNKFGHIQLKKDKSSEIVINGLFKDERIPEGVIDSTIAHEVIHYMHGFQSPHKQRYKHPHAGGIVTREMKRRGFAHILAQERDFVKKDWLGIYYEITGKTKKKRSLFSRLLG